MQNQFITLQVYKATFSRLLNEIEGITRLEKQFLVVPFGRQDWEYALQAARKIENGGDDLLLEKLELVGESSLDLELVEA
jgi:hypothetical protein